MRSSFLACLSLTLPCWAVGQDVFIASERGCCLADDAGPADKFAAIQKSYAEAEDAYDKAVDRLDDDDEKAYTELTWRFADTQQECFVAAVELAKADPKSDVAVVALDWVLTIPQSHKMPAGIAAMEEVTKHHAANPKVGKLVSFVGYYAPLRAVRGAQAAWAQAAWALIDAVANTNPDKTARAQAVFAETRRAKQRHEAAASANRPDAENLAIYAERAFEALIEEYGDCRFLRGSGTVGDSARAELDELRKLRVGKVAPEIEGKGVDGTVLKLSDYRGKVVVVVFWASWCGPCMADVPHEREMTARLKDEPFTIVGVNGDHEREKAADVMAKERMTWPSFWSGPGGPIARAWNVHLWPTVYVLDADGVIRFKQARGERLESQVNRLLKELKSDK